MSDCFELTKIHDFYRLLYIHQYELCIQDIAECNMRRILIMKVMNYLVKIKFVFNTVMKLLCCDYYFYLMN